MATLTAHAEFNKLYRKHSREVWALVYSRWLNADVAPDIMQEAFLRLWKQGEHGETIHNPRAWLLRVARNLARDYCKSAFYHNGTQPPQIMNGIHSREHSQLESLIHDEDKQQARQALATLSDGDQHLVTLHYLIGLSIREIADITPFTQRAIRRRLGKALARLRTAYFS